MWDYDAAVFLLSCAGPLSLLLPCLCSLFLPLPLSQLPVIPLVSNDLSARGEAYLLYGTAVSISRALETVLSCIRIFGRALAIWFCCPLRCAGLEIRLDATCALLPSPTSAYPAFHLCTTSRLVILCFSPVLASTFLVLSPPHLLSSSSFLVFGALSLSLSLSLSLPHGVALAGSIRCTHVHDELHPLLRHAGVIVGQTVRATCSMDSGVDGATSGSYDLACASEGDARKDARGAPLASPAKGRADVTPLRNCVSMHHFSVSRTSSRVCSASPSSVLSFWPHSVSCSVCAG